MNLVDQTHIFEIRNGILYYTFKRGLIINTPLAKELIYSRRSFTQKSRYPALIDFNGIVNIEKDARKLINKTSISDGLSATALVVNTFIEEFVANLLLREENRSIPTKIFHNKNDAEAWLRSFL